MAPVLVPRRIVQQQQEGLELLESELVVEVPLGPGLPHPDEPLPEGLELLESELVVERVEYARASHTASCSPTRSWSATLKAGL